MISAPKTILIVDDEPAVRWLLHQGLPPHLPEFAIATVANGREAIDYLSAYPVDVMVTDIAMPITDGFELLAHVRNHHPNLPVVVLATAAPAWIVERAPQLGAMHVLQKPASPEQVARHVLAARSETVRGRMPSVPLATLLHLMQLERKTCSLLVRSGTRKGRLHFLSGDLVNAYAFDLATDGEAAARHLLTLDDVTIDFERSLHNHVRRIHTPLATLLLEVATGLDAANRDATSAKDPQAAMAVTTTSGATATVEDPLAPPHLVAGGPLPATLAPAPSFEPSLARLQEALVGLRASGRATVALLEASALELERGAIAVTRPGPSAMAAGWDEERLGTAWREVAGLADRLVEAAAALAGSTGTASG